MSWLALRLPRIGFAAVFLNGPPSRHVSGHTTRPAGSGLSTRGKADWATLADPRPERRASQSTALRST